MDYEEYYTVKCICGETHNIKQGSQSATCFTCGRTLIGLFGVASQRKYTEEIKKIRDASTKFQLSHFSTQELADEVALRIREDR